MQCEQIQIQLGSGEPLNNIATEHVETCSNCSAFLRFQDQVVSDAQNWRGDEPNPFLHDRIRSAVFNPVSGDRKRPRLLVLGQIALAAAAAAVVMSYVESNRSSVKPGVSATLGSIALIFTGGGSAQADFITMKQQVAKAKRVHIVMWVAEYLKPLHRIEEDWWEKGALRRTASSMMGGDRLFLEKGDKLMYYSYNSNRHQVISMEALGEQPSFTNLDQGASLESLIKRYNPDVKDLKIGGEQITAQGIQIVGTSDSGYHRFVFLLEKGSRLPIRLDMEHHERSQWLPYMRLDFEFNDAIPNLKFEEKDLLPKPSKP